MFNFIVDSAPELVNIAVKSSDILPVPLKTFYFCANRVISLGAVHSISILPQPSYLPANERHLPASIFPATVEKVAPRGGGSAWLEVLILTWLYLQ